MIKEAVGKWRLRRALTKLRIEFALLGAPLDDLTDDEILEGLQRIATYMRAATVSVCEFNHAMGHMRAALNLPKHSETCAP